MIMLVEIVEQLDGVRWALDIDIVYGNYHVTLGQADSVSRRALGHLNYIVAVIVTGHHQA